MLLKDMHGVHRKLLGIGLLIAASGCQQRRADDASIEASAIGGPATLADPNRGPLDTPERVLIGATAQGLVQFDASGQIEAGLAERWTVIDGGRSFIFRLREARWSDGSPVTAEQVVKALRRAVATRSRNVLGPFLAAVDEIVEMTPQVIEVRLIAPRPDLLKLFAQPELAVFDGRALAGSGPFRMTRETDGAVLLRATPDPSRNDDSDVPNGPQPAPVRLRGERAAMAVTRFMLHRSDLVLGGSFVDWPYIMTARVPLANVRIDPARGLFGLAVARRDAFLGDAANRSALAGAIDRAAVLASLRPDWTPVETILPDQLDSDTPPFAPGWTALPLDQRQAAARNRVALWQRAHPGPVELSIALPAGPGSNLIWGRLAASLGRIGITSRRVGIDAPADLRLIDAVAPYDSARWLLATACVACSDEARAAIEAARVAPDLATRARAIATADAALTADAVYIPIAEPLRWSIVAPRLSAWQGNPRAWHPLNHLRPEAR